MQDFLSQDTLKDINIGATDEKLNGNQKPMGLLDSVLFALTGTPDQLLTDEDMKKRKQRRNEATQMSAAAAENPGEQFMGIPTAGGGSNSSGIGDLIKLGASLFG